MHNTVTGLDFRILKLSTLTLEYLLVFVGDSMNCVLSCELWYNALLVSLLGDYGMQVFRGLDKSEVLLVLMQANTARCVLLQCIWNLSNSGHGCF